MKPDASELALKAAKQLVKDIEFFRSHGTGEMNARYPDHETGDGYCWIVRRAKALAEQIDSFDGRSHLRTPKFETAIQQACDEVDEHIADGLEAELGVVSAAQH